MKYFILLTQCLEVRNSYYKFHFKGAYNGLMVREIRLIRNDFLVELGQEYLIYVEFTKIKNNILWGVVIKLKALSHSTFQI